MDKKNNQTSQQGLNRRSILKSGLGALGAVAVTTAGANAGVSAMASRGSTGKTDDTYDYDVIVIGGGFAGVTAARELRQAGLSVLILEARNRLGGRTFTVKRDGKLFELGGAWVHSTQPNVFAEINRYDLQLVDSTPGTIPELLWWDGVEARNAGMSGIAPLLKMALCENGSPEVEPSPPLVTYQSFAIANEQLHQFHDGAVDAFPLPYDPYVTDNWRNADAMSVRDRLDQMNLSPSLSPIIEGLLGSAVHGAFDQASYAEMLRWWSLVGSDFTRYSDSVSRYSFKHGTQSLIDAMLDDGRPDVKLGTPVKEVHDLGDHVKVVTETGKTYTCQSAISAVPMNVLSKIQFSPALAPQKIKASEEGHAGSGVKFYIRIRQNIKPTLMLAAEQEPISGIMTMASPGDGTHLVAFSTDPSQINPNDHGQVEKLLRRFIPDADVVDTLHYDWHLDPYSQGTWCVLKKGQLADSIVPLRESQGRVHFAGGDIDLGWRGFIDGAIATGNQVGQKVARLLNARSTPNYEKEKLVAGASKDTSLDQCTVCHSIDVSGKASVGPNLRGKYGQSAASDANFNYSSGLSNSELTWDETNLDRFLKDPAGTVPGTTMGFSGVKDPSERAAIIEALRQLK
ncbi:MAG: hypothetical protein Aseana_31140 [Candidatus Pelagadaptatus aseana]|uniref:FAD-dependent oxidoreductase n=1 Tax=Candidatus Pelagadaptatus aseana TaxID=3120508 RepID=UPI0039B1432A